MDDDTKAADSGITPEGMMWCRERDAVRFWPPTGQLPWPKGWAESIVAVSQAGQAPEGS